jgi:hypothetical protein
VPLVGCRATALSALHPVLHPVSDVGEHILLMASHSFGPVSNDPSPVTSSAR